MKTKGATLLMQSRRNSRRGFTAVEIAMVASVIAILALLILPIFRQRAEDAREVAANDELSGLTKALLLVEADMPGARFSPQLSDLDNRENTAAAPATATTLDLEPPRIRWFPSTTTGVSGSFQVIPTDAEWQTVVSSWRGPYIAQRKTMPLSEVFRLFPRLTNRPGNNGPIKVPNPALAGDEPYTQANIDNDRYPLDPWGTPYLFFGPDETIYNVRVIYSLGPDGLPGNDASGNPNSYDRRSGVLGTQDDLMSIF